MFEPAIRLVTLFVLLFVGSVVLSPGFAENFTHAIGSHMLLFGGLILLLWRPVFWAIKLFVEALIVGEGVKYSGVLRDVGPRRRGWFR